MNAGARARGVAGAAALSLLAAGCTSGVTAEKYRVAVRPVGAQVTLETTSGQLEGELLAADDSALLVLAEPGRRAADSDSGPARLVRVHYGAIRRVTVAQRSAASFRGQKPPAAGKRRELRLASRYPQGVDEALLDRLLGAYGQEGLEIVRPGGGRAAGSPEDSLAFLDLVRTSTARYADPAAAIRDGYRAVGPDAPAMGRHWVHPGLVLAGRLDPARPPILIYVEVAGRTELAGVAFALPLVGAARAEVARAAPVPAGAWHVHAGPVTREGTTPAHTARLHAAGGPHAAGRARPGGLAVLHAWTEIANPAGAFATDNWALPYARLGLPAPADAPPGAARALSLLGGGTEFYREQLRLHAGLAPADDDAVAATLSAHAERAREWVSGRRGELRSDQVAWLAALWERATEAVADAVPACRRSAVRDALQVGTGGS